MSTEPYKPNYLKRLSPEYYQGESVVHWSMTMEHRKTGWLIPIFHCKFREILTHCMFRYGLCCPIYCCMPDHIHLLWLGLCEKSDQRNAARFFRKQLNPILEKLGCRFQQQPYDHVLRENDRQECALEAVFEYIARNPERKHLVQPDHYREYPFTGCLVPGYPELNIWQADFWKRFWRTYVYLRRNGLLQSNVDEES